MSEANTISQGSNGTSLPRASGSSDVLNGSDENTEGTAKKASEGSDNETESVSSTQTTTQDDPTDRGVIKAEPKFELDGEKEISNPETDTCQTEQNASTPVPEAQSEAIDSRGNSVNSESVDGVQLPVKVETTTAECELKKLEKEDDEKQILFDEQSKDPLLETPTTDPPKYCVPGFCLGPRGGVEDVPRGGVEDVPRGGVEDVPGGGVEDVPGGGVEDVPHGGVEDVPGGGVEDVPGGGVEDVPGGGVEDVPGGGVEDVPRGGVEDVPRGGVEDVPLGGVEDVPLGGVEDVPDGRTNYSSGLNQPEKEGNSTKFMLIGILGLVLSICCAVLLQPKSVPEKVEVSRVDVFLKEMDRVKVQFPGQHLELWRRSKIHLKRHLQTAHPKEPASLILTAGRRAKRTLHCLAQGLASALSSALNGSVLQIDGDSMAGQDSNQVKFDIDDKLRRAFEGDKPVAVIHRFEELPPGSTIIFYRYCDHENAAYKRASLIFTVLLEGKEEVSASLGLSAVEEMVDDHLKDKFLSSDHPAAFDSMDTDKLSGLWSRISHLILPVAAEERIEQHGCGGT
ncbi:S-antigen protein-like isoform X2 [Osmerus mordax]|uniref:S-antigen protein-like isoform X2 n=1 Tax=Osmerus mordax TaxID=8014 RepID=UPI0035105DB7